MLSFEEVNFDGIVGPTHHYGGLSFGNKASMTQSKSISNPKAAALQGLEKMWSLAERGYAQAILPPVQRPNLAFLNQLGFYGEPEAILARVIATMPELLSVVWSASSMWTANAATVFPSIDTRDQRLRFVPANLASHLHRSTEVASTQKILRAIFSNSNHFEVTDSIWQHLELGDEGAANHTRLHMSPYGKGVHFFVHGRRRNEMMDTQRKFPSRQTELASRCVAQAGHLNLEDCFFARQSSAAIEAGVFHNDVIAVGQGDFLFCHAQAFEDQATTLKGLQEVFRRTTGGELIVYEVPADLISLEAAVETYLFNSQILKKPNGRRVLVVPENCRSVSSVWTFLEGIIADESCPIEELLVQDLSQSMRNGGGPACLRLRVYLSSEERNALSGRVMLDASLYSDLCEWVERNYRSQLVVDDLADIQLYGEVQTALAELEQILKLPGLYTQTSVKHNYAY